MVVTQPVDIPFRIISIYATKWRYTGDQPNSLFQELDLGELAATYEPIKDQLPRPLVHRDNDAVGPTVGDLARNATLNRADSWLFALPSDQTLEAHFGPLRQFTIANSNHPNHTVHRVTDPEADERMRPQH
jgi:hypothetical protein